MLAHPQSHVHSPFTPLRSSPLAARSPNAIAAMSPLSPPITSRLAKDVKTPFSARQSKSNPLLQRQKHSGEQRRREYLQKGRQASENRRFQARGGEDEIMRLVWIAEQKRWENEQAHLAKDVAMIESDDDRETSKTTTINEQSLPIDSEMVEDVARNEDEDLQALVEMLPDKPTFDRPAVQSIHNDFPFGSKLDEQWDEEIPDSDMLGVLEIQEDSWPSKGNQASKQQSMDF